MMNNLLDHVRSFADKAHGTQLRKYTPDRYIVHPIRVMEICSEYSTDACILSAALLHDVLEDTAVTKDEMNNFLRTIMNERDTARTLQLVIDLTDVYVKKDYPHMNRRLRKNKELERLIHTSADSQTVKYADIIDNTREIVNHDLDFARVYLYECRTNLLQLNKGNPLLHKRAVGLVNEKIALL